MNWSLALNLITTFGVLSVLGFGGGKGIFPQMRLDVVNQYHWISGAEFASLYAIGKMVPGPATIMVTLLGFGVAGLAGAVIAALAMFVPSSLIMFLVGKRWDMYEGTPLRAIIAGGLAPVIIGMVFASVTVIGRGSLDRPAGLAIVVTIGALSMFTSLPSPLLILGAGAVGAFLLGPK